MQRERLKLQDYFVGDWNLFVKVVNNPKTIYMYDADGIIINSSRDAVYNFNKKHGFDLHSADIDKWLYLTEVAKKNNLGEEAIRTAEDDYYNPDVLEGSGRYFYIKPLIGMTMLLCGADNNYVLTSREPYLTQVTNKWFGQNVSEFLQENILIREDADIKPTDFKVSEIKECAKRTPWVVFIDDSAKYVDAVLDSNIENCLVINVPLGKIKQSRVHERLIVIDRYPQECQGMYLLYKAFEKAIQENNLVAQ